MYPHAYQITGSDHLRGNRFAYLADDMGLGKTVQACHAVQTLPPVKPWTLVVCPAVVREVWADHLRTWGPKFCEPLVLRELSDTAIQGAVREGRPIIVSYTYATKNRHILAMYEWDVLIVDEAQMAKTHGAQRTRALFGREGIARSAKRVWWLSGTPIENHPGEIWMPMFYAGKTTLSYQAWVDKFCVGYPVMGEFRVTGANPAALPELRQLLRDCGMFLKRTRKQVFPELPPRPVNTLTVESHLLEPQDWTKLMSDLDGSMSKSQLEQRLELERGLLAHALGVSNEFTTADAAFMQGLAKSVSTLRRYNGMLKVSPAVDLARHELDTGQVSKLAFIFVHEFVGKALEERLSSYGVVRIDGSVPEPKRHEMIKAFNTQDNIRICLMQLRACGTGITVTGCTDTICVETEWDSGSLAQALGRVRQPPGVSVLVTSRILVLDDPLDRAVMGTITRKAREIENAWG